jgi:hypothetical protein
MYVDDPRGWILQAHSLPYTEGYWFRHVEDHGSRHREATSPGTRILNSEFVADQDVRRGESSSSQQTRQSAIDSARPR